MKTFREHYCECHGIGSAGFERMVLKQSLYWHARPIYLFLRWDRRRDSADYELVRLVGNLRGRRGFHDEVMDFHSHESNRHFVRSVLRLRVSTRRLRLIFEQIFPAPAGAAEVG